MPMVAQDASARIPVCPRAEHNSATRRHGADAFRSLLEAFAGNETLKTIPKAQNAKAIAAEREPRYGLVL
ncbi:hypothetical protein [Massilia sp. DWR3-1-1]|uniref:hypothetical protein n=1 Tax=Massilia sp. DWR3-1-1 TaxID=2804559 RepID=UPI003CF1513E